MRERVPEGESPRAGEGASDQRPSPSRRCAPGPSLSRIAGEGLFIIGRLRCGLAGGTLRARNSPLWAIHMDLAEWLRGLGLEQYAPAFRDNDIDGEVLRRLTAEDLRELGIASIGHRRRLLDAIAALGAGPISPEPSAPAAPGEAERRQLTVMFCDLVGSTALAGRHDPEDLREVIGAYHRVVAETVGRFAGFVAKYMGDGVLVYFGYPQAHEDDAERAVRAGLAVVDAIAGLDIPERLAVRLGVASGLVVVGDLLGEGAAQERGVVGETPNLAARLQGLAEPGTAVIADRTRRQLGTLFDVEDLGVQPLAGFAEKQRAWRVLGESGVVSRYEALRSGTTPLVGRDEEIDLLLRRWEQAKTGEGRVVLISGEPGLGKSRLTAALAERIEAGPHTRLRYFCSPHHQDSALYPFIGQLERAAEFARDDTAEQRLGRLEALLAPGAGDADEITLIAELLSLPNTVAELNFSPQRKREKLFEALLGQLEAVARIRPVRFVFEDAHWIDPTSRELMDLTLDRVRRLPVLLVVTFRPEFQHAWGGQAHVTVLALNRLDGRAGVALVQNLAGNAALDADIVAEIVERTDGVPLFVEELTKAVLESADRENRVAAVLAASPAPALAIPATLHASLIARLDRLGAAPKEVAQIGAVLGREFAYELIDRVARRGDLDAALARLSDAGLLFCRGVPPHSSYLFKHALVQDAAYGTLLRVRRQELHARVAAVLEPDFADLVERQPELLAHHLTGAGQTERAVDQWLKAGQFAAARLAHLEAIAHLQRGIGLLSPLPASPTRDAQEIELQLALGLSLLTTKGMWSDEVGQAYERARELAEKRDNAHQLFQALYGLWQHNSGSGRMPAARSFSQRLLRVTERGSDSGARLQAHHSAWTTALFSGEAVVAHEHTERGRRLYDPDVHRSHRYLYGGHDPGVCARVVSAQASWFLGHPDKALASAEESVALAEKIAHPYSLGLAFGFAGALHLYRGEPDLALRMVDQAHRLATEQRFTLVVEPSIFRGAALAVQGECEEAIAEIRGGLVIWEGKSSLWRGQARAWLAEALTRRDEHPAAVAAVKEGLADIEATSERSWEAELHRVNGIVLLAENKPDESETCFRKALEIARRQQAKSLELRRDEPRAAMGRSGAASRGARTGSSSA
jgi:class 3 adenylate cyclase/tetratricopeptide (TPR) repeat protein